MKKLLIISVLLVSTSAQAEVNIKSIAQICADGLTKTLAAQVPNYNTEANAPYINRVCLCAAVKTSDKFTAAELNEKGSSTRVLPVLIDTAKTCTEALWPPQ